MQSFFIILCLILMVVSAAAVVLLHSLLKGAICLAATSVLLAVVLFLQGAYWAALFELSVCAGLITVVFISAISITARGRLEEARAQAHRRNFAPLPYILLLAGMLLLSLLLLTNFQIESAAPLLTEFNQVFWHERQADIVAQVALILAGAFGVVVLFKERDSK